MLSYTEYIPLIEFIIIIVIHYSTPFLISHHYPIKGLKLTTAPFLLSSEFPKPQTSSAAASNGIATQPDHHRDHHPKKS
jgi:hypothetical protein